MGFERDLLDELANVYSEQLAKNNTECPQDGCSGTTFGVEVWVGENDRFLGEGLCLTCNQIFELDLDDSQVLDEVNNVSDAFDDFKDTLDDF